MWRLISALAICICFKSLFISSYVSPFFFLEENIACNVPRSAECWQEGCSCHSLRELDKLLQQRWSDNCTNSEYVCKLRGLGCVQILRVIGTVFRKLAFLKLAFICGVCFPYLFLIFSSFNASGGLCVVTVAFPGYLHLYMFSYDLNFESSHYSG